MLPPNRPQRVNFLLVPLALLSALRLAADAAPDPVGHRPFLAWQRLALEGGDEAASALAFEPRTGRVAVAAARGAFVATPGAIAARVLRRGPVNDVAFLPDQQLLAATFGGLYLVESAGTVSRLRVGAGEAANAVTRIAVGPGLVAVASGSGVHASRDGRQWQRLVALPLGAAGWVVARPRGDAVELWSSINGEVWAVPVAAEAPLATAGPVRRVVVPGVPRDAGAVDAVFDLPGAESLLLYPSALLLRVGSEEPWRILRPVLPPGASALRIAFVLDRYWLVTDAGLLAAPALEGPWQRIVTPGTPGSVRAAVAAQGALLVADGRGVLRGRTRGAPAQTHGPGPTSAGPDIRAVHRAALTYLSLEPARLRALQRGVERRAWLPILALRAGHDRLSARRRDHDESVSAGVTHQLLDEQYDFDRNLDLDLTLSWDLGGLAYHPEEIDVLRESRAVIELRDDVLDEITQLYFERRRVLGQLAVSAPDDAETRALALRADELAAGLDAWTGGWFSAQIAPP